MTRDEIFAQVRDLLAKSFEIDPAMIKPEALLFQELELDSIDAIDMVVQLQEWTGRYVPEESLRGIRTVDDVVSLVEAHLAQGPSPAGTPMSTTIGTPIGAPGAGVAAAGPGADATKGAAASMSGAQSAKDGSRDGSG